MEKGDSIEEDKLQRLIDTMETFQEEADLLSKTIEPINRETVHKICSGQVVLSLAIAVKELVENAIDAGATIIDVKLKEYGNDLIEVADNGSGVLPENFAALTLKHHTSKIKQFSDLESVETLGFRGEALSSLCALSNVTITTRHSTSPLGTRISYDHNGKIILNCTAARSQGTTVSIANLFSTLPVRKREFTKNLKREFNKMCQLLYAYCLVSLGIKISCVNTTGKGTKSTIVSTQASNTIHQNIISVFGPKQISPLIEVPAIEPTESTLQEYNIESYNGELPFQFDFLISSTIHGSGRSTSDRQFFYINSRPCEPTKVIKLVNEIYRQYNGNQYPFVYFNIITKTSKVDVNVTPDKRQIFLEKEKLLLAIVKTSLLEAFKCFPSTFTENSCIKDSLILKGIAVPERNNRSANLKGLKRSLKYDESSVSTFTLDSFLNDCKNKKCKTDDEENLKNVKEKVIDSNRGRSENQSRISSFLSSVNTEEKKEIVKDTSKDEVCIKNERVICKSIEYSQEKLSISNTSTQSTSRADDFIEKNQKGSDGDSIEIINEIKDLREDLSCTINISQTQTSKIATVIETNLDTIKEQFYKLIKENVKKEEEFSVLFKSKIDPSSNKEAEKELQRQISKDKFKRMEIIGQFNLGFIVTKLENDLFIIDQHATDEKYNYEQLQKSTVLETQVLVNPKTLNLTAVNENILIDNEEIFKKNGFNFVIDNSAKPTERIQLTSIPMSKNYIFGQDDIDELLFMLQDGNCTMCRPSRVQQMFASRACRKSVMIGRPLTRNDMRKLVDHMSDIDQPWNCPHGRPTMRHLINLKLINTKIDINN